MQRRTVSGSFLIACVALLAVPGGQGRQGKQGASGTPAEAPTKAPAETPTRSTVPAPPPDAAPLPPVLEPARSAVERRDLMQRFAARPRISGLYRLQTMMRSGGTPVPGSEGYLYIGMRHLTMQVYAPSPVADRVHVQAAVRTFTVEGNQLITRALVGHRNKTDGDVVLDKPGEVLRHTFALLGARLRIHTAPGEYLEFQRIE